MPFLPYGASTWGRGASRRADDHDADELINEISRQTWRDSRQCTYLRMFIRYKEKFKLFKFK